MRNVIEGSQGMAPTKLYKFEKLGIVVISCWPKIGGIGAIIGLIDCVPNVV